MIVCEQYGCYKDYKTGRCRHCGVLLDPMISFDEVYKIVEESASEAAFNREEARELYNLLLLLPEPSNIVEIGIQYGRSTSVIASVAKHKDLRFTAIDNWKQDVSQEARNHVLDQIAKYDWKFNMETADSVHASKSYALPINLIHIDGDHEYSSVLEDCRLWLPKVVRGGYALFDDYGHDSLPGVYKAVSEYTTEHPQWKFVGRYGNKLGVFKRE